MLYKLPIGQFAAKSTSECPNIPFCPDDATHYNKDN